MSISADKLHLLDFSDVVVRGRRLQARYDLDCALDEMGRSALSAIEPVAA